MSVTWPMTDVLEARLRALDAMDGVVRSTLAAGAARWRLPGSPTIERTDYPCVYSRTPSLGGHWTLFGTSLTDSLHMTATVTVTLEFDGDRPVDLWVSGERDVAAGGCTTEALAEALDQCGGPLRQITPVSFDAAYTTLPLSGPAVEMPSPTFVLN